MKERECWCIPVPKQLDVAVERAIENNAYVTKSDLVRDAVRRRLEEIGTLC